MLPRCGLSAVRATAAPMFSERIRCALKVCWYGFLCSSCGAICVAETAADTQYTQKKKRFALVLSVCICVIVFVMAARTCSPKHNISECDLRLCHFHTNRHKIAVNRREIKNIVRQISLVNVHVENVHNKQRA